MSDLHELQLTLDLPGSLPGADLVLLRWHLGEGGSDPETTHTYPLLSGTGPAERIGGVLVSVLAPSKHGWALTVRQEVRPDEFDQLRELVGWLVARTSTFGTIGYLRHLEQEIPDMLVADPAPGTARRITLTSGTSEVDLIPHPWD
ncbi:hypothetical protein ACIO6T_30550 [Streptomyces sp. NPDC087532]|uniref:hypothetical protein n=1 Tax=Streptomyces sp. NPDC087532 TaxID=3365795 RepID=UPI0037F6F786